MKLRNRKSTLTALPDTARAPSKIRPATIFYYLLIAGILLYALIYGLFRIFFHEFRGHVYVTKINVATELGGKIEEIHVAEQDEVTRGQPLVRMIGRDLNEKDFAAEKLRTVRNISLKKAELERLQQRQRKNRLPVSREFLSLHRQIALKKAKMAIEKKNMEVLDQKLNDTRWLSVLEAYKGSADADGIHARREQAFLSYELLRAEIRTLEQHKARILALDRKEQRATADTTHQEIQQAKDEIRVLESYLADVAAGANHFRQSSRREIPSPADATVQRIYIPKFAFAEQGKVILALLPEEPDVHIRVFFHPRYLRKLRKDKRLSIRFPDGEKTKGIVRAVYSSASRENNEILDHYIPVRTKAVAEVIPEDPEDIPLWMHYDQMDVTIKVRK